MKKAWRFSLLILFGTVITASTSMAADPPPEKESVCFYGTETGALIFMCRLPSQRGPNQVEVECWDAGTREFKKLTLDTDKWFEIPGEDKTCKAPYEEKRYRQLH